MNPTTFASLSASHWQGRSGVAPPGTSQPGGGVISLAPWRRALRCSAPASARACRSCCRGRWTRPEQVDNREERQSRRAQQPHHKTTCWWSRIMWGRETRLGIISQDYCNHIQLLQYNSFTIQKYISPLPICTFTQIALLIIPLVARSLI